MSDIIPTVGRHVYLHDSSAKDGSFAAVITEVGESEILSLHVMTKTGCTPKQGVSRGTEEGQWDWMPYQKDQAAKEASSAGLSAAPAAEETPAATDTVAPAGEEAVPGTEAPATTDAPAPAGTAPAGTAPAGEASAQ